MRGARPRRSAVWLALAIAVASCSTGPAATVDGFEIGEERIANLHPDGANLDDEQQASSLFLIILHHIVSREAEAQFAVSPAGDDVDAALAARLGDDPEIAADRLADRGITEERVVLEAELDVLRALLQRAFIDRGGPDVDLDAAYRTFLGVNSRACVLLLAPASEEAVADMERATEGNVSLDAVSEALGELVEPVELGCDSPSNLPLPVQSVALDGEVGRAYLSTFSDGTVYVAGVTSRDAPAMDAVIEDVKRIASDSQGATLFDEWAFDLLRNADVSVDPSIGTWEPQAGAGDVPSVVPSGGTG